jgi:hypothetical protein
MSSLESIQGPSALICSLPTRLSALLLTFPAVLALSYALPHDLVPAFVLALIIDLGLAASAASAVSLSSAKLFDVLILDKFRGYYDERLCCCIVLVRNGSLSLDPIASVDSRARVPLLLSYVLDERQVSIISALLNTCFSYGRPLL